MSEPIEYIRELAPWGTTFASVLVAAIGWVRSSRDRRHTAELEVLKYKLEKCQNEMVHFSWIPEHGEAYDSQLVEQYYINTSKLGEISHLFLSQSESDEIDKLSNNIYQKLVKKQSKNTRLEKALRIEIENYLEKTRKIMKDGTRDISQKIDKTLL